MFCTTEVFLLMTIFILNEHSNIIHYNKKQHNQQQHMKVQTCNMEFRIETKFSTVAPYARNTRLYNLPKVCFH